MDVGRENQNSLTTAVSEQQRLALIGEAQSALNLMTDSISAIRTLREPRLHGDAVFSLGSIGVEKIMKILLGCAEVERSGAWPTKEVLQSTWGHNIRRLSADVVSAARAGLHSSSNRDYAEALLDRIEASTILPLLFATLSGYGLSGRFYNLDVLATDDPGKYASPLDEWYALETHVAMIEPRLHGRIPGDPEGLEEQLAILSDTISDELEAWWYCVHALALLKCFGLLGFQISIGMWDLTRPSPASVPKL